MVVLELPYPPSANRYWRNWQGRMVVSSEAKAYKEEVGWRCRIAGLEPTDKPVALHVKVYRPIKNGDLDNRLKIVLDALQKHVYLNDNQIKAIYAHLYDDKQNPRVEVRMRILC